MSFEAVSRAVSLALLLVLTSADAQAKPGKPFPGRVRRAVAFAAAPPLAAAATPPLAAAATIAARPVIPVTVVEVAAHQVYLKPGATAGVVRGSKVTLNRRDYKVAQATDSFAMIVIADEVVRERDKGEALPSEDKVERVAVLPTPTPLSRWEHAWTESVPPAALQVPRPVPLGGAVRDRSWDARLSSSLGALLPLQARGDNLVRAEIAARVHAEPIEGRLALDFDGAVQRWFAKHLAEREGGEARPTVFVRELRASYAVNGYATSVGRLRYAASTLGTLDGVSASAPLGEGISLGAFGGLLPDPLSGAPSGRSSRFGIEASYRRSDLMMRPDAALVVHGSMFDGRLDERRLSGALNIYPGTSRLGAHLELSSFDADNPWRARPLEVAAVGFDSSVRVGPIQVGGRFDLRKPERSRWLASYLPASWFCSTTLPTAAASGEVCDGAVSTRAYGAIDAGLQVDRFSLTVGATTVGDLTQSGAPSTLGAFALARVVRLAEHWRVEGAASVSRASYIDLLGGSVGPGLTMFADAIDLSLHYRVSALQYRGTSSSLIQHGLGAALTAISGPELLVAAQAEAITGDDTRALVLLGTMTWRPGP